MYIIWSPTYNHICIILKYRCAHYTEGYSDAILLFLHFYSRYMAGEKKVVEDESEKSGKILFLQFHWKQKLMNYARQ